MRLGVISLALAGALALAFAGGSIAGTNPDTDSDGVFDLVDNCVQSSNAPLGGLTEPQEDFDEDGFGQNCDADFNNTGTVNISDFNLFFGCFSAAGGGPPVGSSGGIDCRNMDMNSTNTLNISDFNLFFAVFQNPGLLVSGLPCARPNATDPNMTGRHPCVFDPTPNN